MIYGYISRDIRYVIISASILIKYILNTQRHQYNIEGLKPNNAHLKA